MTTSYWFIRHGPTHATGFAGHRDIPADLSDKALINRLNLFLPKDALIQSSDLSRARETAIAIRGTREILPEAPEFREMDFGDWDGKNFDEVARSDPQRARDFWDSPGDIAPPNGESWNQLSARIKTALDQRNENGPQGNLIIVAHFAVILAAIQIASGMEAKSIFSFKIDNFSVTKLDYLHKSNNWRVMGVNHLV